MKQRDKTVDNLRGLAMLWVIVVHTLYWGKFFDSTIVKILMGFCLFEMPLFFFVTGAGSSFGGKENYFKFVSKRYKKLLIPYWCYAIICAGISILPYYHVPGRMTVKGVVKVFLTWLIPVDRQITSLAYLNWATWFVPVYLSVVLLIPLMRWVKETKWKHFLMVVIVLLFVITSGLQLGWIQNLAFYSIWVYMGLFYKEIGEARANRTMFRVKCLGNIVIGVAVMILLYCNGETVDMQSNKFPPNIMFAAFSVVVMTCILFLQPYLDKCIERIKARKMIGNVFEIFSLRSVTIFLYQTFALGFTINVVDWLLPERGLAIALLKTLCCLIMTIPLCVVVANIFGKIEEWTKVVKRS